MPSTDLLDWVCENEKDPIVRSIFKAQGYPDMIGHPPRQHELSLVNENDHFV